MGGRSEMLHRNLRDDKNPGSASRYMNFGQLIIRKIIKIISTVCHILKQKCTKFDSWCLSACPFVCLSVCLCRRWSLDIMMLIVIQTSPCRPSVGCVSAWISNWRHEATVAGAMWPLRPRVFASGLFVRRVIISDDVSLTSLVRCTLLPPMRFWQRLLSPLYWGLAVRFLATWRRCTPHHSRRHRHHYKLLFTLPPKIPRILHSDLVSTF